MLMLMATLLPFASNVAAQEMMPQLTPLPLKEGVKSGVLPNGLHYYVLHNEEPKNRANFYIAQKVGSTLETPEQLGLAHFLEHMAFNGTKTYPGKNLLNYLQSKGIRFGADINAYTGFDETVYNIDNVPCSDQLLMDSVLLALRDWSSNILLEETEIEAERGVIHEEWRTRNDARTRMFTSILPQMFEEYQYHQMPIGSMDVVMNFKPQALRDYYHKWYRPDQQGIIIVGDFDAAEMEKKVVDLFSQIPMPENAEPRIYQSVSDNKEPIYATFEDPEMTQTQMFVGFKYDLVPFEYRNTVEMYLNDDLLKDVLTQLFNNRLEEYSHEADCRYAYASAGFSNFYVASTKGLFNVVIIPKDDPKAALEDAMGIIARACSTGFTDSELERVDSKILSSMERLYNERDKTSTSGLAQELIRHFVDNTPMPGIEVEYDIVKNILPQLPVQAVNATAAQLLTPENQVIVVAQPQVEGKTLPAKETMVEALNSVLNAKYEAYVDEVITDPLLSTMPKAGKIKSEKTNAEFETVEMMLSNGVKVVVKSTDFENDNVNLTFFKEGGKSSYAASEAANVNLIEDAYDNSNFGSFDNVKLRKYLAGKHVSLGMTLGLSTLAFEGKSTVKDLPTLFELLTCSFIDLNPNKAQYEVAMNNILPLLESRENDPMVLFQKAMRDDVWNHNPVMANPDAAMVKAADYDKMFKMIKDATANAANYTMILTGNIDLNTLRPLLEQYVASLPSKGKKDKVNIVNPISITTGAVSQTVEVTMQTPSVVVYENYNGVNIPFEMKNEVMLDMLGDVLDNKFTETLREEEGGTYGASVYAQILPASKQWQLVYSFQTNQEMSKKLIERAKKETFELLREGTNATEFNKVRGAAVAQLENKLRTNEFWQQQLLYLERGYNLVSGRLDYLKSLTLEDFNNYIKTVNPGDNNIQVILDGVAAK